MCMQFFVWFVLASQSVCLLGLLTDFVTVVFWMVYLEVFYCCRKTVNVTVIVTVME